MNICFNNICLLFKLSSLIHPLHLSYVYYYSLAISADVGVFYFIFYIITCFIVIYLTAAFTAGLRRVVFSAEGRPQVLCDLLPVIRSSYTP